MPVPFLLIGAGAVALAGAGGHLNAKQKNEKAQLLSQEAQSMYNDEKLILEKEQKRTEASLMRLGQLKHKVLTTSISQFVNAYDRVKDINFRKSVGLDELSKFSIDTQGTIELREMTSIYRSSLSSGVAGAATGAVLSLAVSGTLPLVTSSLSVAGTALAMGEVGMAASFAGSALSFGAAATPLAAIAAPIVLFTGISSSIKAEENLEKARTMYAEAEAAIEEMKISETLCSGIIRRADMYERLLNDLNNMFAVCAELFDGITQNKIANNGGKISAESFSDDEIKLIAVSRALAGAVKSVIDTPMLNADGSIASEAQKVYDDTYKQLPEFRREVEQIKTKDFDIKKRKTKEYQTYSQNSKMTTKRQETTIFTYVRNIMALIVAFIISNAYMTNAWDESAAMGAFIFSTVALLLMNTKTDSKFLDIVKHIECFTFSISAAVYLAERAEDMIYEDFFWILSIIGAIVLFFVSIFVFGKESEKIGNIRRTLIRLSALGFCYVIALVLFAILYDIFDFSSGLAMFIIEVLFVPCALISTYLAES